MKKKRNKARELNRDFIAAIKAGNIALADMIQKELDKLRGDYSGNA